MNCTHLSTLEKNLLLTVVFATYALFHLVHDNIHLKFLIPLAYWFTIRSHFNNNNIILGIFPTGSARASPRFQPN